MWVVETEEQRELQLDEMGLEREVGMRDLLALEGGEMGLPTGERSGWEGPLSGPAVCPSLGVCIF